jgi:hypothetical protein
MKICKHCGQKLPEEVKKVVVDGWEYDTKDSQLGTSFEKIKIPNGSELWTAEDTIKLYNDRKLRKKLNLEDCWFWVKHPYETSNKKNVARFRADSVGAYLDCKWGPTYSYA